MAGRGGLGQRETGAAWLARRAFLALALMVGFYALSIAVVAALLWVPYAEIRYLRFLHAHVTLLCLGAAAAILWSLVPRRDRFEEPGPKLTASAHPRLFALIDEVASATGEHRPDEVFLLPQVNAFVTHRGGVLGWRSRRVMGVGLPLLLALSVNEFRAVVAHEFGHYGGGDVRLAPLVYRTRLAIARTVDQLRESRFVGLFIWYGRLFLKLTHAVSREQEFVADAVAARVAGAGAQAAALRRVTTAAVAFDTFMEVEVLPVLHAGFLPPIADGFRAFCASGEVAARMAGVLREAEASSEPAPFDTHPPLGERLAALGAMPVGQELPPEPAARLLDDPEAAARSLLEFGAGADAVAKLRSIEWAQVADAVIAPAWRSSLVDHGRWLAQFTVDRLPATTSELAAVGAGLADPREFVVGPEERADRAGYVLGAGIACILLDRGWKAETGPGRDVQLVSGADTIDPFAVVRDLTAGSLAAAQWESRCQVLGIAGVRLGAAEPSTA